MFLLFSVFLLWRGHNAPGGGFTGGLVASGGLVLYAMANGSKETRRLLRLDLKATLGIGLLMALAAGLIGILNGGFYKATWVHVGALHLGTPLLFDIGVYLVVASSVLTIVLAREEF